MSVNISFTTNSGLSGEGLTLPISKAELLAARATVLTLHDALGHAEAGCWSRSCSPQSEAAALIHRNPGLFPAVLVAKVQARGLRQMQTLYALTLTKGWKAE